MEALRKKHDARQKIQDSVDEAPIEHDEDTMQSGSIAQGSKVGRKRKKNKKDRSIGTGSASATEGYELDGVGDVLLSPLVRRGPHSHAGKRVIAPAPKRSLIGPSGASKSHDEEDEDLIAPAAPEQREAVEGVDYVGPSDEESEQSLPSKKRRTTPRQKQLSAQNEQIRSRSVQIYDSERSAAQVVQDLPGTNTPCSGLRAPVGQQLTSRDIVSRPEMERLMCSLQGGLENKITSVNDSLVNDMRTLETKVSTGISEVLEQVRVLSKTMDTKMISVSGNVGKDRERKTTEQADWEERLDKLTPLRKEVFTSFLFARVLASNMPFTIMQVCEELSNCN